MTAKTAEKPVTPAVIIERWDQVGRKLVTLAEAFPEDRYEFAPVAGVRTFGDVLRHVAFWNRFVADSVRGKKADDSSNELPKSKYATKAQVVDALKRSAADAAASLRDHRDQDITEVALTFIEHTSEHYGQLAVYARLNGVVPPASR